MVSDSDRFVEYTPPIYYIGANEMQTFLRKKNVKYLHNF